MGLKISVHGGHSGQFCTHARDSLAEMVAEYHRQGFACVCLTEHMPPESDAWRYADEVEAGLTARDMQERFQAYVDEARRLSGLYAGQMTVLVGMESEWYPGVQAGVARWRGDLDVLVGSVHHVGGICFDYSPEHYAGAVARAGGLIPLYLSYLDAQWEMLVGLRPEVVGHFDLIRMHDQDYVQRIAHPQVWSRITRNLKLIGEIGAVLDVNSRALLKGQPEPYVCKPILEAASSLGIRAAFGDDAHGVDDVGRGEESVRNLLTKGGFAPLTITGGQDRQGGCREFFSKPST